MKKYLPWITIIYLFIFSACEEDGVTLFNDEHEVYFEKFFIDAIAPGTEQADSTKVSFFFASEDEEYADAILEVNLSGRALTSDLHFGLRAVEEGTTALPNEYILAEQYTFHARPIPEDATVIKDSVTIRFRRSKRLADFPQGLRLVVELTGNSEVGVGQYERSRAVLILTEDAVQPEWWTEEVEAYLLGSYSPKKYKLFLQHVEGSRKLDGKMIAERPDQAIKLVRAFKKWLSEQNPPVYEENGDLMYVNV